MPLAEDWGGRREWDWQSFSHGKPPVLGHLASLGHDSSVFMTLFNVLSYTYFIKELFIITN